MLENTGWRRISGVGAVLLMVAMGPGCSSETGSKTATTAGADSIAYAAAMENEDDAARFTAFEQLVQDYPGSRWSGRAYYSIVKYVMEHDPERTESVLEAFAKTDYESPSWYNAVGWHLAEEEKHLDHAVAILEKAVAKARASEDTDALASCLDSEAWARYKKGDYGTAMARMEEAHALYDSENDELDSHLALIYDAAGEDEKALELYISLLGHMESPEFRKNLDTILASTGGSNEEINARIDGLRTAGATPVPDFTMPSLADATPITLSDYRGKVVLLSFWHPT